MMSGGGGQAPSRVDVALEGGPSFTMGRDEDSLLRGALRAGLAFPYECSVGGCGSCRFELLEGEVQTLWEEAPGLSERERRRGRRLACQSRPLTDCRIRVRLDPPVEDPLPPRRMRALLKNRRALTHDMTEFTFRVDGDARFRAGQYALLWLPGTPGARAYSMSHDDRGDGQWRFIVRRVPEGAGSAVLFQRLRDGDAIDIDGPYGHAWLRSGQRDVVCVAGGSGLGPMLSVAEAVLRQSGTRLVHFLLGLRSQADLGGAQWLSAQHGERWRSTVVLSDPVAGADWPGPTGYVHQSIERVLDGALDRFDFYLAGPPPMVQAVQDLLLLQHRVPRAACAGAVRPLRLGGGYLGGKPGGRQGRFVEWTQPSRVGVGGQLPARATVGRAGRGTDFDDGVVRAGSAAEVLMPDVGLSGPHHPRLRRGRVSKRTYGS